MSAQSPLPNEALLRAALRFGGGLVLGLFLAVSGATLALAEPPIRSAQDAACRDEARDKVFTAPNPQGLGLEAVGRQIYNACMQRANARGNRRARPAQ